MIDFPENFFQTYPLAEPNLKVAPSKNCVLNPIGFGVLLP